jgi:hypothetical protein
MSILLVSNRLYMHNVLPTTSNSCSVAVLIKHLYVRKFACKSKSQYIFAHLSNFTNNPVFYLYFPTNISIRRTCKFALLVHEFFSTVNSQMHEGQN